MGKIKLFIILQLLLNVACDQKDLNVAEYVQHIVLFKFQNETPKETLEEIEQFAQLLTEIEVVKDFHFGVNTSPERLDQGFKHCLIMKFDSAFDRDSVYLPHPDHLQFVKNIKPHIADVIVFDFNSTQ